MRAHLPIAVVALLLAASASAQPDSDTTAGTCSAGTCRDGTGTMQYADGTRYEGAWQDGRREGVGALVHPEGWTWTGLWRAGSALPTGQYRFDDGTTLDGPLPSGLAGAPVYPADTGWSFSTVTPIAGAGSTAEEPYSHPAAGYTPPADDAAERLRQSQRPPSAPPASERRPDGSVVERLTDGTFRVVYSDGTRMNCSAVDTCDRTYQRQQEALRRLGVE